MYDRFAQSIWRSSIHTEIFKHLAVTIELGAPARHKSTNGDRVLPFKSYEVYMRQRAVSLFGAVASPLRFAVIAALLAFTPLPFLAQEQPIPAELSFLNKIGKPYRITYEPWTEMQIPEGNRGSGGVGKVVRGKHWQFPVIVPGAMNEAAVWAIIKPAFLANGWTRCMSGQREESSCFFTTRKMGRGMGRNRPRPRGTRLSGPD